MSTLKCIIVEDQPPAQRVLIKYIKDAQGLQLVESFHDALFALEFLKKNKIDLIFLDIHLPRLSGIDFLKILNPQPHVILTTAFPDYALESYELNVVDYLLKPFSYNRFLQAVEKIKTSESETKEKPTTNASLKEEFLFVKSGVEYLKIAPKNILYIKSDGDYSTLHLKDKKVLLPQSLKHWIRKLQDHSFFQVHKSYIVNTYFIEKVSGNQIYLDEVTIPIGRTFKEKFVKQYLENDDA